MMYYRNFWKHFWYLIFLKSCKTLTMLTCCLMQLCMVPRGFVGHSACQTWPSSKDEWLLGLHVKCGFKFYLVWTIQLNYLFMHASNLCKPYFSHQSKILLWDTEYSFIKNFPEGRMNSSFWRYTCHNYWINCISVPSLLSSGISLLRPLCMS